MMATYYNEYEPYAAEWLRNLIKKGLIPNGEVDTRSIINVSPDDLRGFTQCHFFAGLGGWAYAGRLAGWPDDRPLWTGSAPCQPFSTAGQQKGTADERHLWPVFFGLIRACRPPVVMGEQVAAAVGKDWLDGVSSDLEGIGYACGAVVVPACAVNAPHRRDRLWFVAHSTSEGLAQRNGAGAFATGQPNAEPQCGGGVHGDVADAADTGLSLWGYSRRSEGDTEGRTGLVNEPERCDQSNVADASQVGRDGRASPAGCQAGSDARLEDCHGGDVADADESGPQGRVVLRKRRNERSAWSDGVEWAIGADGKARRVKSGIRLLAHGVSGRMAVLRPTGQGGSTLTETHWYNRTGALKAFGNAIVPQVAAEVIGAYLDAAP